MGETVILPIELHADEYGTIWNGAPGGDGSVIVGDLLWWADESTEAAAIRFLPPEQWQTVRHSPELTLGGTLVTEEEAVDGGHLTIGRVGEVPFWMEQIGWRDPQGRLHPEKSMYRQDDWTPVYALRQEEGSLDGE